MKALNAAGEQIEHFEEVVRELNARPSPPDRSEAVNLARNLLEDIPMLKLEHEITPRGVNLLAEAVLRMDAWILEVDRKSSDATSACLQPAMTALVGFFVGLLCGAVLVFVLMSVARNG